MGIFDKLKQAKNYLSGGGVKVDLILDESAIPGEGKLHIKVLALVEEYEILADKLYINVVAEETIKYRENYSGHSHHSHHSHRGATNRTKTVKTFKEQIIIDEDFRLDPYGEYEWEAIFNIPDGYEGTYRGINAFHEWKVLAGISKKGNDPDSGWKPFVV